jgi:signal transduction histidine kinase
MVNAVRVLYVDDEPILLEIAKLFIERDRSFTVDTLISAKEALERLNTVQYDAIISDYLMPEMDGIAFLKQLKASGNTTPFIIFTGRGREEVAIEALNCGADFYIQKGGNPKAQFAEISNKVHYAVTRRRAEKALVEANKKLNLLGSITRHDINNQLTILMSYLDLLEKKQPDPSVKEYFLACSTAANRIATMIQFTKEYESIGVNAPVWKDCRTLVETAANLVQLGTTIVKNDIPAGMEVFADPLVVKVFYNLIDNVVRYGRKVTTIRFFVEESADDYIIVAEDDGDGVLAEEKEKIFERGYGKNTGLGLFFSREILSITGITINENGEPGKGARFEIHVPYDAHRIASM